MTTLKGKIDFALLVSATDANPNGDPLKDVYKRQVSLCEEGVD